MEENELNERLNELAKVKDWQGIVAATEKINELRLVIISSLWQARALRALSQGEAANKALLSAAHGKFEASISHLAEIGEELVQCAFYEQASKIAASLESAKAPQADYLWAMLWREREYWDRCSDYLARLSNIGEPWKTLATIQNGWSLIRQGRLIEAKEILSQFAQAPHPGLQKLYARLELASGQYDAAKSRLEKVAAMQPLDWEWPSMLALALTPSLAKDNSPHLFSLYEQGLQRQPRQAEALVNRARLRLDLGDKAGAQADCNAALAVKSWLDAPVLIWVEQAVAARDFDRAEQMINAARKHLDTPKRACASLDILRFKGSKNVELAHAAEAVVRQFPDNAVVLRTAGASLQAGKKFDRAAQCYAHALELVPDDIGTRNNLAMLYKERGDFEEAINIWRAAINNADDTVRLNYAFTLLQRGDRLEAENIFNDILKRIPQHPVALRGMAEVAFASGEDDAAWKFAITSLKIDPKHPLAWKTAAGIAQRREGVDAAIKILEQGEKSAYPVLPMRQSLFIRWRSILDNLDLRNRLEAWKNSEPNEVEYWLMLADAAHDANDFDGCEHLLQEAYRIDENQGGKALVRFYEGRERFGSARRVAEQMTRSEPDNMRNWGLLAETNYRQERFSNALEALEEGLKRQPERLSIVRQKVGMLLAQERFDEAVETATKLVKAEIIPPNVGLLLNAFYRGHRFDDAVTFIETLLVNSPKDRIWRIMYAGSLRRAGKRDDALKVLQDLYKDEPENFEVSRKLVRALIDLEKMEEAIAVMESVADRFGERPDVLDGSVAIFIKHGALEDAEKLLNKAIEKFPRHLAFWQQKAEIARKNDDAEAEQEAYNQIINLFPCRRWAGFAIPAMVRLNMVEPLERELNRWRESEPNNSEPWWAAFHAAKELKQDSKALEMLEKIEKRKGKQSKIHSSRAGILQDSWRLGEAIDETRKAIALTPTDVSYHQQILNIMVKAGDFDEFDQIMAKIKLFLGDRRYYYYLQFFFNINCHPTWTAAEIWEFYHDWYEKAVKPDVPPAKPHNNLLDPERKLKLGYVSPDFRRHAVAYFSEPLLCEHDRTQFELFAYAHLDNSKIVDPYTERFKSYFDHWIETKYMSDDELERRIRDDGIDILIDLAGHTAHNRLSVFIRRPAPIQASWIIGSGQTTGLPQIDAFLTPNSVVPIEHHKYIAEKTIWELPFPYVGVPFKPAHDFLEPMPLPCLKNGFITFGVLARPLRTNRLTIAVWAKILKQVPTALLRFDHIPYAEEDIQKRMKGYFAEHGIGEERLLFLNTRPHWKVYQEIDIQLDPFPAGSGTTATEGLFMERLVIALKGRPPIGSSISTQLLALGLTGICDANNEDEYISKAVALANDTDKLLQLSTGLRERMKSSWLMDYAAYGREAAKLYRDMWRQYCEKSLDKDNNKLDDLKS